MHKIFFLTIAAILLFTPSASAQKKEMATAKTNIKAGKSLPETEASMRKLLADSANRSNTKIWLLLFESIKKQYESANEDLYLKQTGDTAKLFDATYRMFAVSEGLDSVETSNGNALKYRKKHAEYLYPYRPNLFSGGTYFTHKKEYRKAFDFFDKYIDCANQPLFTGYEFTPDKKKASAAFLSVFCGYKLGDASLTLKHKALALQDSTNTDFTYQYLAETYKAIGDTTLYADVLHEGFAKYPTSAYFFPRLFEHYLRSGDLKKTLALCDEALSIDSTSNVFLLAKSTVLLHMGNYGQCSEICKKVIAKDSSIADAYLNAGLAYYNQAVRTDHKVAYTRETRAKEISLYKQSLPYMKKYRDMMPGREDQWATPLYNIYFNLNMGKEFEEIDKIIKKRSAK